MSFTWVEFDKFFNFAGSNVDSDRVVRFDQRIWITDSPSVTSDDTRNTFQSDQQFLHFAQLVLNRPE